MGDSRPKIVTSNRAASLFCSHPWLENNSCLATIHTYPHVKMYMHESNDSDLHIWLFHLSGHALPRSCYGQITEVPLYVEICLFIHTLPISKGRGPAEIYM